MQTIKNFIQALLFFGSFIAAAFIEPIANYIIGG